MKLHIRFLTLILFGLLIFFGCEKSNSPSSENIGADTINWVGSEIIFTNIEGKKENSIIFFYADWCGYCHKMDQTTFSDADVASILNQSFNNVRINAESDTLLVHFDSTVTGRQMKVIYEVGAYPPICVWKGDGDYLTRGIGYTYPDDFVTVLHRILDGDFD